jgi:ADP-heptose:LPS heptosyltransferase
VFYPHRLGEPLPRRIGIFRALQLGDLLCLTPALRALRTALPDAKIVLIGLPWAKNFVARFSHYLDGFREFPGYPGLPEQTPDCHKFPAFIKMLQEDRFDLILQMHGSGIVTNHLVMLLEARCTAGFFLPGGYCPDTERYLPYPAHEVEIRRHLQLLEFLGIPLQGEDLEFPLHEGDYQELQVIAGVESLRNQEYVCIHPGARAAARRWPPERYAAVADHLTAQGLLVVLTGSAEEASITEGVRGAMHNPALDLAGRTSLGALAALLDGARLLICNDTGVSHLAAALRLPSVVVFHGLSELQGWPPLNRQLHRVLCRSGGVTPHDVLAEVEDLLRKERRHDARSPIPFGQRFGTGAFPSVVCGASSYKL